MGTPVPDVSPDPSYGDALAGPPHSMTVGGPAVPPSSPNSAAYPLSPAPSGQNVPSLPFNLNTRRPTVVEVPSGQRSPSIEQTMPDEVERGRTLSRSPTRSPVVPTRSWSESSESTVDIPYLIHPSRAYSPPPTRHRRPRSVDSFESSIGPVRPTGTGIRRRWTTRSRSCSRSRSRSLEVPSRRRYSTWNRPRTYLGRTRSGSLGLTRERNPYTFSTDPYIGASLPPPVTPLGIPTPAIGGRSLSPEPLYSSWLRTSSPPPLSVPPIGVPPPPPTTCFIPPPSWAIGAELLTYQFDGKLAYVPAGRTYDEALNHAVSAFPALAKIGRERISFHVAGLDVMVRIPGCAWTQVLRDLPKYEIVAIEVEDDSPPEYKLTKDVQKPKTKKGFVGWFNKLFGKA